MGITVFPTAFHASVAHSPVHFLELLAIRKLEHVPAKLVSLDQHVNSAMLVTSTTLHVVPALAVRLAQRKNSVMEI